MKVLGFIPARRGSKGIPQKNMADLAGKPLILYTIEAAKRATLLDHLMISTDDPSIADFAMSHGVTVPFLRPSELAFDTTPMIEVVHHALNWLEDNGMSFEAVMLLQPTSPFRKVEDVDGAIRLMEKTGCDSVISFVDVGERHPARMKYIDDEGRVVDPPFGEAVEGTRRQELEKLFLREGSIYLTRSNVLREQSSFKGKNCRAWIIPEIRAQNIDTPFNLFVAEQILKNGLVKI